MSIKTASDVKAGPPGTANPTKKNPEGKPTPTPLEFALVFNDSASRKEVVTRLQEAGFHMNYGNAIQREKSYTDPARKGGPINLKKMSRGSSASVPAVDINEALAAAASVSEIVADGDEVIDFLGDEVGGEGAAETLLAESLATS